MEVLVLICFPRSSCPPVFYLLFLFFRFFFSHLVFCTLSLFYVSLFTVRVTRSSSGFPLSISGTRKVRTECSRTLFCFRSRIFFLMCMLWCNFLTICSLDLAPPFFFIWSACVHWHTSFGEFRFCSCLFSIFFRSVLSVAIVVWISCLILRAVRVCL